MRDGKIRELTRDPDLMLFLYEHFDVIALSTVKREFLKRELQELKESNLDLVHYATLIREARESGNMPFDHPVFIHELKAIFQRYIS